MLLSLQKLGTHELIYARDPKAALGQYQDAPDGFLDRLKAEESSVQAKMDVVLAQYYVATADLRAGDRDAAMAHYRECRDIREGLAKDPKTKLNSLDLMLAPARTDDQARASEIAEGMIKEPPMDARIYFHSACGFALSAGAAASMPATAESTQLARHDTDRALDALRLALKHGWGSAEEVATTRTSTRSAPIPASCPCSRNSARRGREGEWNRTTRSDFSSPDARARRDPSSFRLRVRHERLEIADRYVACVPSLWVIARSSPDGWGIPRQCVTQAPPA